jgi:hypothetical protein
LYVFTGEDTTSAFRGNGKANPLKKVTKEAMVSGKFPKEEFTCKMYRYPRIHHVNKVHSAILHKMVGAKQTQF